LNTHLKSFFNRFLPYFKDYKKEFAISFTGMFMAAGGAALSAYIIKPVLDKIFIEKDEHLLYILPFALILIYAFKSIGKYLQIYYASYIGLDIVTRLRDRMLEKIISFEMDFFHKQRSGELISRTVNDVERIKLVVSNIIPHLLREALTIIILLGYILYLDPVMALMSIIFLPLAAKPLSTLAKKMKALSFRLQEKISDLTSRLSEMFNNIEMIKANGVEEYELQRFKEENHLINKLGRKAVRTTELVSPMMEILGSFAAALIIFYGGKQVIAGDMSVGSFFSFLTALFMLYTPIKTVSRLYNQLQDAVAASERIFSIIDRNPAITDGTIPFDEEVKQIKFENVSLSYENKVALKNINLTAKRGEKIALVGNSGGGKSSIVNLLLRFYDPNSGKITFNDQNIKEITMQSLRESISIVTQRVYILKDTIANNIAYGRAVDEEKVISALKQANAWEFVSELSQGIHTPINEFGTNLSGGQRQRIAIARAIYRDPQIFIFDEATSALDTKSEAKITQALENIAKNKIVFIIAHRLKTVENADKIIVLKEGEIVCEGTHQALLKNCEEFKHLHGLTQKES
jgi:subfamily B ATP-binding cassette protein MsbA